MKRLKLFAMGLLSMAMCVSLTSCGGDEDEDFSDIESGGGVVPNPNPDPKPNPNPDVKTKKLVEIRDTDSDNYELKYKFYYDSQNRLSKMEEIEDYSSSYNSSKAGQIYTTTYDYTWEGNKINIVVNESTSSPYYYTLSDGKIISYDEDDMGYVAHWDYAYNGSNQLVSWGNEKDMETYWFKMTWNNGSPQSIYMKPIADEGEEAGTYTFEYSNQTCTSHNPSLYTLFTYSDELLAAHPSLMGKVINTLPTKIVFKGVEGSTEETTIKYVLDKEGYLIHEEWNSISKSGTSGKTDQWSSTYDYVWQ